MIKQDCEKETLKIHARSKDVHRNIFDKYQGDYVVITYEKKDIESLKKILISNSYPVNDAILSDCAKIIIYKNGRLQLSSPISPEEEKYSYTFEEFYSKLNHH